MRQIVLVAGMVSALIASAIGFDVIDLGRGTAIQTQYGIAWLGWSAALVILAGLVGDRW